MEFNRINNSNKIIRSGENINKKEILPANEIKSEDKIKEFSSDYSSASRALGLYGVVFKGNLEKKEKQLTFEEQKENLRKKISDSSDLKKREIDKIINLITEKNFEIVKILFSTSLQSYESLKGILDCLTEETFEIKNEYLKYVKDKKHVGRYERFLTDTDIESVQLKKHFCEMIEGSDLDAEEKHNRCLYIIAQEPKRTKEAKKAYDYLCSLNIFPKEKIIDIFSTGHSCDIESLENIIAWMQRTKQDLPDDDKFSILKHVNNKNIGIAKILLTEGKCDTPTLLSILNGINEENMEIYSRLIDDKIVPYEKICKIGWADKKTQNLRIKIYEKFKNLASFDKEILGDILREIDETNYKFALKIIKDDHIPKEQIAETIHFYNEYDKKYKKRVYDIVKKIDKNEIKNFGKIFNLANEENFDAIRELLDTYKSRGLQFSDIVLLIDYKDKIKDSELKNLRRKVGAENYDKLAQNPICNYAAAKLQNLYGIQNINELNFIQKRNAVRNIVKTNSALFNLDKDIKTLFPILPTSKEEYCAILPALVKSLGIETNQLSTQEVEIFNSSLSNCAETLSKLPDEEFNNLSVTQDFTREKFIETINEKISHLSKEEKQKVYDYYGFEIHEHSKAKTGYTIVGYPINLNNGKKLSQIENPETKKAVEAIRSDVVNFSENNKIICNNKEIENELNKIAKYLPEIHSLVGKNQHRTHSFDVLKHSLKVIQKTAQNPSFKKLNDEDKNLMLLTCLMHDLAKYESAIDRHHESESAFDAYFIAKKFNLSRDNEIKLYTLIKNHDWFKRINTAEETSSKESLSEKEKQLRKVAFTFQHDNLFEMAKILTEADLKSIKSNDSFYNALNENNHFIDTSNEIQKLVNELQKTRPMLPTTKLPKASEIKAKITTVNPDYSTNIKGVYQDENGMIIIRYNEVENWEELGFAKGETSKGISFDENEPYTTGTIKFIAHGLERPEQVANFDAFSLPESDAMLSVSYMERPESKYRLFRTQGVLLDVDSKYVYGGGETDAGSGCGKNVDIFIEDYAYKNGHRHKDRVFVSNLIKRALNLNDEEYINFLEENKNKSFSEIEPKETREKLIKEFTKINSAVRQGERSYNEMYVSNPEVHGVFAYSEASSIGDTKKFMEKERIAFLKKYALENDVPFVLFGD